MTSSTATRSKITLDTKETQAFSTWLVDILDSDKTTAAQQLARRLGAHYRPDRLTEIAFWVPDVEIGRNLSWQRSQMAHHEPIQSAQQVYLTTLTPLQPVDFRAPAQKIPCQCERLPLQKYQNIFYGVFSGLRAGTRDQAGTFYCLQYIDSHGQLQTIGDILAYSLPYGVFAPAELYDVHRLQQQRSDLDYFAASQASQPHHPRIAPPQNILQLHVGTASAAGTLEGLTEIYRHIADKLKNDISLTPAEENYVGYDAVQLLPLEPVAEDQAPGTPGFMSWDESLDSACIEIHLRKPNTQNWGYDTVLHGSAATNPALLGSLRPDELIDFIATLHNFPTGPIQVIYDLVYGHTDNQAKDLLQQYFLQGPNMYGQDINHQNPTVRAILLEMQRRKINTGADGVRIDGAQDFRFFNATTGQVEYDDQYLEEMGDVRQTIGENERLLFTIYEDGRPWPAQGWEEKATYRDVIERQPDAYQWGPLIFAHNTPTLNQFWKHKWQRIREVMDHGSHWISGCANHDTMRRGIQLNPQSDINWNLGQTLPDVIRHAYDNPAVALLFHGFSPGIPMDFLNATMRAPWSFFRNTDSYYGLKVAADEVGFLDWQIKPQLFEKPWAFKRIKKAGVTSLQELRAIMGWLHKTVMEMQPDYDLDTLAQLYQQRLNAKLDSPPQVSVPCLQSFAKAYMEDCHDLCNVSRYAADLDAQVTQFNRSVRQYRHAHPWLQQNLTSRDIFTRLKDSDKTVFYGLRTHPNHHQQVAMVCHLGGQPVSINVADLFPVDLTPWQPVIVTPGLKIAPPLSSTMPLKLRDGQGLMLESGLE